MTKDAVQQAAEALNTSTPAGKGILGTLAVILGLQLGGVDIDLTRILTGSESKPDRLSAVEEKQKQFLEEEREHWRQRVEKLEADVAALEAIVKPPAGGREGPKP